MDILPEFGDDIEHVFVRQPTRLPIMAIQTQIDRSLYECFPLHTRDRLSTGLMSGDVVQTASEALMWLMIDSNCLYITHQIQHQIQIQIRCRSNSKKESRA